MKNYSIKLINQPFELKIYLRPGFQVLDIKKLRVLFSAKINKRNVNEGSKGTG